MGASCLKSYGKPLYGFFVFCWPRAPNERVAIVFEIPSSIFTTYSTNMNKYLLHKRYGGDDD